MSRTSIPPSWRRGRRRLAGGVAVALAGCLVVVSGCARTAHGGAAPTASSASPVAAASTPRLAVQAAVPSPAVAARAAATARPNPCAGNDAAQLVRVSVRAQHLWMCAHTHLVRDTPVTTGMVGRWTSTPTGHYTIQPRTRNTVLTLASGRRYHVRYWIPFDAPLYGFHDSSWQTFPYGSPRYRTDGSHGCVHLPLKAIAFLYRWAHVGARVVIT